MNEEINTDVSEQLWAYVHGQLADEERHQVEKSLIADPALKREYDAIKEIDSKLRFYVPLTEISEDDLEHRVLSAWQTTCDRMSESKGAKLSMYQSRTLQLITAIAACFLVVLGIRNYTSSPIEWTEPQIQAAAKYRGEGGALEHGYSQQDFRLFSDKLKKSITKHFDEIDAHHTRSFLRKDVDWVLVTKWQELVSKSLYVQIEAYEPDQKILSKEWSQHYADSGAFLENIDDLAAQVAGDLADISTKDASGR